MRDYGTGTWVGGDPNCEHKGNPIRTREYLNKNYGLGFNDVKNKMVTEPFKSICPLCGAIREDKQIGLEDSPEEYIEKLINVFREVRRVLKDDGTLWVNIGDSYAGSGNGRNPDGTPNVKEGSLNSMSMGNIIGHIGKRGDGNAKPKDLIGIPWMLAFALRDDGWYLRQDIIWHKPNPMPESVKDRCTKSHEYIFLLSKNRHYYFDHEAIQEEATGYDGRTDTMLKGSEKYSNVEYMPNQSVQTMAARGHERWNFKETASGETMPLRNKRDVWSVSTKPVKEAHFATFPEDLIEPCILAGSRVGGIVLDPFFGSGTTGRTATKLNRHYIGCELNPEYVEISNKRTSNIQLTFVGMI